MTVAHVRQREKDGLGLFCGPCRDQLARERATATAALRRDPQLIEPIRINGCTLRAAGRGRCRDYLTCGEYMTCLEAASDRGWLGWRSERRES